MKKLYSTLFFILPFFVYSQETCTHKHERGVIQTPHFTEITQSENQIKSTTSIPYNNSFENGLGDFTVIIGGDGTYNWEVQTGHFVHDDDYAAGGYQYLQHDDVDQGAQVNWALTPTFDLSGAGNPQLTYWDHVHWADYADCDNDAATGVGNGCQEVMYSTDYTDDVNSATWVVIYNDTFDNYNASQSNPGNAWGDKTLDLPAESNVTVAFRYSGNFASDWLIDDITVKDNAAVSANWSVATAGGAATLSIADLNNFTVGTDGHWHYTIDGGSEQMVYDTNDITISGLSAGEHTIVAWLVDNNHNPLDPAVEVTITFNVVIINSYPWCDDFESGIGNWTSSIYSGTAEWVWGSQNLNGSVVPLSGAAMTGFYSGNYNADTASIISPSMDLTSVTDPQLIFNYTQVAWSGDQDQLRVFYRSSHDGDWVQIGEYTEEVTSWTEIILDLPNPSADYYVGFQATSGYGYGVTLDDVCVQAALSTSENELLDMRIYPNPVDGNFVTILSPVNGTKYIEVFDINGRRVMDTAINNNTLDVSSINSGFYMIKVTVEGQSKISKLVIR